MANVESTDLYLLERKTATDTVCKLCPDSKNTMVSTGAKSTPITAVKPDPAAARRRIEQFESKLTERVTLITTAPEFSRTTIGSRACLRD